MSRLRRVYGASPWHLLALVGGGAVSLYAVTRVGDLAVLTRIAIWFAFMLVVHDLLLFPAYAALDNVMTRLRGRRRPRVPWVNHVRAPAVLSGLLLIAWYPLVLRLAPGFPRASGRTDHVFLGHWLAVTVALFAVSGISYVARITLTRRAPGDSGGVAEPEID